jgi:hypothetical protein
MKTTFRLAVAAAFGVGAIVANVAPASAQGTQCTSSYGSSQVQACETVSGGQAGAYLQAYSGAFFNYTLAIEECRGDLTNCITFSSTSGSGGSLTYAPLPSKTCAYGHVYRVHASWVDSYTNTQYVDARSGWTSC